MSETDAVIAANRFGLGALSGDLAQAKNDPQGWVLSQVSEKDAGGNLLQSIMTTKDAVALLDEARTVRKSKDVAKAQSLRKKTKRAYFSQSALRTRIAIQSPQSFRERLVHFWSNHFAVSTDKNVILAMAGPFEQEAIRPNVTKTFYDLLLGSTQHPAMLLYLDNAQSFGPNSRFGRRRNRGLNENLAREVLELHTVGVNGGYSQSDVTNFAKILTGWTVPLGPLAKRMGLEGETFAFVEPVHEPGAQRVMGKIYSDEGINQGKTLLRDLARHEKTARHIALKLVRHFVADVPPGSLVKKLTDVFLETDGDLKSIYTTLIQSEEAWQPEQQKFKTPFEWIVSTFRALGMTIDDKHLRNSTIALAQPTYQPNSPAGWPDIASAWDGPSALGKRIEWANTLANRLGKQQDSVALATATLGRGVSNGTLEAIRRAESNSQALTLLLMSPEFLRR